MASGCSRRDFIRKTAIGAASVSVIGLSSSPRRALGYVNQDPINPSIDNLRVVYIEDDKMTRDVEPGEPIDQGTWDGQNKTTFDSVVSRNIDRMALTLAEGASINESWKTIFIKPAAKNWSDVVVAIKTNNIAVQHTRNAVMKKFCEVLVNELGVTGSNVHIYDACHGGDMTTDTPWYDLPAGVQVESRWGGSNTATTVPPPYTGSENRCQVDIANGTVDILINIALCKGHGTQYGTFTMTLKNHFGTFRPIHQTNYLFSINKSEAILGPMDPGTGRIIRARQQLCFIDALWASQGGPSVRPSCRPNMFVMGTFGPAIDYQVATIFRRDTMGWSINQSVTDRFLTEFGYGPGDFPNGGDMFNARASLAIPRWKMY